MVGTRRNRKEFQIITSYVICKRVQRLGGQRGRGRGGGRQDVQTPLCQFYPVALPGGVS